MSNKTKKSKKKIEYLLDNSYKYASGGTWNLGTLNQGEQLGNSGLNGGQAAAIGQISNLAGQMGSQIIDNAIPDQDQRINVNKQTGMSALKGAGTGASIGANPLLVGATAGLSIPIGAAVGAIGGGLIGHNAAEKAAKQNHDALMQQYYPDAFANGGRISYADGGNLGGDPTGDFDKNGIWHKGYDSKKDASNQFLKNWYENRKIFNETGKVQKFYEDVPPPAQVFDDNGKLLGVQIHQERKEDIGPPVWHPMPTPRTMAQDFETDKPQLLKRLSDFKGYEKNTTKPQYNGYYMPNSNKTFVSENAPNEVKTHELNHYITEGRDALGNINDHHAQLVSDNIKERNAFSNNPNDEWAHDNYKYYTEPTEIHSRIMSLRQQAGMKPDQEVTEEFLNNFFKTYKGKNKDIDDLLMFTKDKSSILNLLNGMASVNDTNAKNIIFANSNSNEAKGLYALGGHIGNTPNIENQFGNQMSEFKGAKHTEGGIQLGQNAEVEAGEVKWKDYIFSDQLTPENKDATFASIAKRIKNKYKGRENDKKANQALEAELSRLSAENDIQKQKHEQETMNSHINDLKTYGNHVQMGEDGNPQYSDGGKLELIKGARKAGLSLDQFVTHLSNAKVKYANGGDWKFQQFEDSPITNTGDFRGSIANYGIGDYNYTDDRDFTTTAGAEDYPRFNNNGNYPIKPKSGSFSSVDYNTGEVFPHDISTGRSVTKQDFTQPSTASFDGSSYLPKELQNQQLDGINTSGSMQSRTPNIGAMTADQLPQRDSNTDAYDKFLDESLLKDRNRNTGTGNSKFGYAEAGLIASNLAGVDNLIKSMKPAQTNFERVKFDRLNLQQARDLNARDSALGQRMTQANVRNNATSSGQALSNLAASNAALTEGRIKADMSTYLQEEQANTGITNQERGLNNQISREEYIANEQNKANAQSVGNFALANMGQNTQMYGRDKVLTQADVMSNKRYMDVLNTIAPNYQWNVDPESDKLMISYISKLANK